MGKEIAEKYMPTLFLFLSIFVSIAAFPDKFILCENLFASKSNSDSDSENLKYLLRRMYQ